MNKFKRYEIALMKSIMETRARIKQRETWNLETDSDEASLFHLEKELMEFRTKHDEELKIVAFSENSI